MTSHPLGDGCRSKIGFCRAERASASHKKEVGKRMAEGNGGNAADADKRRGRPTMTDVARIAGVSQSSVSLVLNQMTGSRISARDAASV
jgi:hypothetical protein